MKRWVTAICGSALSARPGRAEQRGRAGRAGDRQDELKAGDVAPDFTLLANNWKQVKSSDYRGKKNVILAFYVLAFTGG